MDALSQDGEIYSWWRGVPVSDAWVVMSHGR